MQERPWLQWNIQRPHCPNILGANKQFIKVICGREPTAFDPLVNSCLTQNNFLDFPEKIKGDRVKINYFFLKPYIWYFTSSRNVRMEIPVDCSSPPDDQKFADYKGKVKLIVWQSHFTNKKRSTIPKNIERNVKVYRFYSGVLVLIIST